MQGRPHIIDDVAVDAQGLGHRYGDREALKDVSFQVRTREVFGLLGPNGSGKTTLFRILSTALAPASGSARVLDADLRDRAAVRRHIGVVFQAPSLDKRLTVAENLRHHGHLYGLSGTALAARIGEMVERFKIADRAAEVVEKLSGGMQRRVEIAKAMLHAPKVLILDEPSTGLDPGARRDLMEMLRSLEATVLLTTHLMEEAARCDRVAILDQGKLVASGSPESLRAEIGGEIVTVKAADPAAMAAKIGALGLKADVVEGVVRVEAQNGAAAKVTEACGAGAEAITISKPTLEDVFLKKTGHTFWKNA